MTLAFIVAAWLDAANRLGQRPVGLGLVHGFSPAVAFFAPGRTTRVWGRIKDLAKTLVSNPMEPAKTIPVILGTLVMVAGAVALWLQVGSGGGGNLHVYFFDVGQDDSALIVTPEGRQVLVDGGPNADSKIQALSKTIPLVIAALIWWC